MKPAGDRPEIRRKRDLTVFWFAALFHLGCCFFFGYGETDSSFLFLPLAGLSGMCLVLLLPADERRGQIPGLVFVLAFSSRLAFLAGFFISDPAFYFSHGVVPGFVLFASADLLSILFSGKRLQSRQMPVQWLVLFAQNPLVLSVMGQALAKEPGIVTGFLAVLLFVLAWGASSARLSFVLFGLTLACQITWGLSSFLAVTVLWLPWAVVFWLEGFFFLLRRRIPREKGVVRDVSVVIPARNEERAIKACLESLGGCPLVREILVVDGGSTDTTREIAVSLGARVIVHDAPPEQGGGRGGQIKRGVMEACGDVVAVVHADTLAGPELFSRIIEVLNRNPGIVGGSAGTVFDDTTLGMKMVEFFNALRAAFFSVSFGDQIQFFRRHDVANLDLYPGIPLMEDVELSLRLPALGRTVYLFGTSMVSSRRWRTSGAWNAVLVLSCFFFYLIQRLWKTPDAMEYYRRYYGKGSDDVPVTVLKTFPTDE